jgi:hypothetical protein
VGDFAHRVRCFADRAPVGFLSRLQFGFVISFHIIFPAFMVGWTGTGLIMSRGCLAVCTKGCRTMIADV